MDSTGHIPEAAKLDEYYVFVIDYTLHFIDLYPVRELSAKTFATCLLGLI